MVNRLGSTKVNAVIGGWVGKRRTGSSGYLTA